MIIYLFLFIFLIYLFVLVGTHDYEVHQSDKERFSLEYGINDKDHVFSYISAMDAHMIASGKKGIVFFGNSSNIWCKYYANILNDVAKSVSLDNISYYDFYPDRENNNATYEDILNVLKDYVLINDKGKPSIYAPSLLVFNNVKVLYFETETSFIKGSIEPSSYWTKEKIEEKKQELQMIFLEYLGDI